MAKTICFSKIQLCATSHNCIFWVLDNFYCHKTFMGSYYRLYTIFYNSFYVPNIIKILVLIGFYLLWPKLKKTGLDWFQPVAVPVFWYFWIRQLVAVASCLFLGQKTGLDRTRPANTNHHPTSFLCHYLKYLWWQGSRCLPFSILFTTLSGPNNEGLGAWLGYRLGIFLNMLKLYYLAFFFTCLSSFLAS